MKIVQILLLAYIVREIAALSSEGVIIYVKPDDNSSPSCPNMPCETLQTYFTNSTMLELQKNVTMIFLNGTHLVDTSKLHSSTMLPTPVLTMIGESADVIVTHDVGGSSLDVTFYNNTVVAFEKLMLIGWTFHNELPSSAKQLNFSSVSLVNCSLVSNWSASIPQIFIDHSNFTGGGWQLDGTHNLILCNSIFQTYISVRNNVSIQDCTFVKSPVTATNSVVVLSGSTIFKDVAKWSAVVSINSTIVLSGEVSFKNNHGVRGGAIALFLSTLSVAPNTNVTFINNSAEQHGGAIYISPGIIPDVTLNAYRLPSCFYELLNCNADSLYNFFFENNFANDGGDNIYGYSHVADYCYQGSCHLTITEASPSNSSISSNPLRVCLCDDAGEPQCENDTFSKMDYTVHPGEQFTISLALVGGDLGLTTGIVYASVYNPTGYSSFPVLSPDNGQAISTASMCTQVNYSIYSKNNSFVGVFLTTNILMNPAYFYGRARCESNDMDCLLYSQVFINFTILSCPPGFNLLDYPPRCECYPILTSILNVTCYITKQIGYFAWDSILWMKVQEKEVIFDRYCPHHYCRKGNKSIDLLNNSSSQCDVNRSGRLCGRCKKGYSLAIGSSKCILCQNNNNLALFLFFLAAGFLLVCFIGILNITVTQGYINGLIFYANIVWTYKDIFIGSGSNNAILLFLQAFIAWINLDFGIETCFIDGLTAFWKTTLQFIFPFYVWAIAGVVIVASRYSTKLTNLLGNRAVPLLATLFFLSYMKLLRTAMSALEFSILNHIDYTQAQEHTSHIVVWSEDGNLGYFDFPHILLFFLGLATLLFLWMPYTLLLFLMQWLRRLPQCGPLKWIMKLHPIYDAYFAPLKNKHQYWFGVLLLARGILLIMFASSFAIPQNINLLLLLISSLSLLYYMVLIHPYKSRANLILQSSYFFNLSVLSGIFFFTYAQPNGDELESVAIKISIGFALLQFCGTVLHAVIVTWCCQKRSKLNQELHSSAGNREVIKGDVYFKDYRDSILNESEPLVPAL